MALTTIDKTRLFEALDTRIREIVSSSMTAEEKLDFVVNLLKNDVPYYDWVGFYLVDVLQPPGMLTLGKFAGEATDHIHIRFGEGICGQAAERLETFVVQDVSQELNYLSCSVKVKSEIVLPIIHDGNLLGELDIDSHQLAPFTPEDEAFLNQVCTWVAPLLQAIA